MMSIGKMVIQAKKILPKFPILDIIRRIFLKIFPWWHVDSWPKPYFLGPTIFSTTELTLGYICNVFEKHLNRKAFFGSS